VTVTTTSPACARSSSTSTTPRSPSRTSAFVRRSTTPSTWKRSPSSCTAAPRARATRRSPPASSATPRSAATSTTRSVPGSSWPRPASRTASTPQLFSPTARYPQDIQTSEAIQSQLAEVGINASIETMEWNAYLAMTQRPVDENEITMAMLGWGTVTGDADYGLYALFHTSQHPPVGFNRGFYATLSRRAARRRAHHQRSRAASAALRDALQILRDDAAWLFLYSEAQIVAFATTFRASSSTRPSADRRQSDQELNSGAARPPHRRPGRPLGSVSCATGYLVMSSFMVPTRGRGASYSILRGSGS
jgi:hypothetical protein